ncbi:3-dehydroquinate synthase [Tundrisphaera sp. TA3]|uniref:3-dehydroquinate synthase n=1 Tax=Tundrisphaera sp. TA3 TaxID=3435775 RepID=UPI003EB807FE
MQSTIAQPAQGRRVDSPFAVTFHHRLRYTDDVLGQDRGALVEVLEPSGQSPAKVQIFVDSHVADARPEILPTLAGIIEDHPDRCTLAGEVRVVPGGESIKNDRDELDRILRAFNDTDLDRRSYVVVAGGGAVLDAVGFAAAVAHRGIRLVRLPTTTLAQADSGVGVKNAVNFFGKKNWMGAFAVPWAVINDAGLLSSLPDRDFIAGFSEAVKVALLKSPKVFDQLCRGAGRIRRRDLSVAMPMIRASVEFHLAHIAEGGDPFEALEARPLDFGHWSAHKLEPMTGFAVRHGEAVAIGVAIDAIYSSLAIGLPWDDSARILRCLSDLGFTLGHPMLRDVGPLLDGLEEFRQHLGGRLTVTMLRAVGDPVDVHEIDRDLMREAIGRVQDHDASRGHPAGEPLAEASGSRR